jgi:hypothetical protein
MEFIIKHPIACAIEELSYKRRNNFKVDSRLEKAIAIVEPSDISMHSLNRETFLNIEFPEMGVSRVLTPLGESRTLLDVVNRMKSSGLGFASFCDSSVNTSESYDPRWFEECKRIYNNFEYSKVCSVFVHGLSESSLRQSPTATFGIFDGTHRSLVLAYKLIVENFEFQDIRAFVLPSPDFFEMIYLKTTEELDTCGTNFLGSMSLDAFQQKFANNPIREDLFRALIAQIEENRKISKEQTIVIFGSYVTEKEKPGDIDILCSLKCLVTPRVLDSSKVQMLAACGTYLYSAKKIIHNFHQMPGNIENNRRIGFWVELLLD